MITRIGTRAQSKLPTQFGVELSGINVGYRASTREPDFADQSLAAGLDGQNPSRGQMCCHLGKHRRLQRSSPVVLDPSRRADTCSPPTVHLLEAQRFAQTIIQREREGL